MAPVTESEVITGERLQALADVILLPRMLAFGHPNLDAGPELIRFASHRDLDERDLARISASRSIFVYADAIGLFQEHVWPRLTGKGYVLITHNSDHAVGSEQLSWIESNGGRLAHWFAQNLVVDHPKLSPLPIGLANRRWPHGDIELLCQVAAQTESVPPSSLIHADFDPGTHPDRKRAWEAVRSLMPAREPAGRRAPSFADYLWDLARHRFCACPRGNGIDTHRFWECLYLGVIPVVERSPHTDLWARAGVPMVPLDDWSELSRERLESYPLEQARTSRPDCLHLSHHARAINEMTALIPTC